MLGDEGLHVADSLPRRFSVPAAQCASVIAGGLFAFIGVGGVLSMWSTDWGQVAFAMVIVLFGVWFSYRGFRSSTVLISSSRLVLYSFLRKRRFLVPDVTRARVGVGSTGPNGWGRQYLVLELADGTEVGLKELNARPPRTPGAQTVVERCVVAINEVVSTPPVVGS